MKKTFMLTAVICLFIVFQSAFAWEAPKARNLKYDGSSQYLVTAGVGDSTNQKFFYRDPFTGEWGKDIPAGKFPGKYQVEWIMIDGNRTEPEQGKTGTYVNVVIKEYDQPQGMKGLVYDGSHQNLINVQKKGTTLDKNKLDTYYFRNPYTGEWGTDIPSEVGPGVYKVEYILWGSEAPAKEMKGYTISNIKIAERGDTTIAEPVYPDPNNPANAMTPIIDDDAEPETPDKPEKPDFPFFPFNPGYDYDRDRDHDRDHDGREVFDTGCVLPPTGFPTRFNKPLAIQPETIRYEDLSMRIQIPSINVDTEMTGVPAVGGSWAVEWLGNRAGLLSGSAMPGEGYAMIAAHNTLNAEETGPFYLLFGLKENDRIFVNTAEGGMQIYAVYANELVEPGDMQQIASIAENEEGSLILVTCENEALDGGYMNRRAVFAKPLF